jgi:hypothetical protein
MFPTKRDRLGNATDTIGDGLYSAIRNNGEPCARAEVASCRYLERLLSDVQKQWASAPSRADGRRHPAGATRLPWSGDTLSPRRAYSRV